jgi:hypothetical protein
MSKKPCAAYAPGTCPCCSPRPRRKSSRKRKPIPLYMLDTLNAYQARGHVVSVFPFAGKMSLDGFPEIPYSEAFAKMTDCLARQAEAQSAREEV